MKKMAAVFAVVFLAGCGSTSSLVRAQTSGSTTTTILCGVHTPVCQDAHGWHNVFECEMRDPSIPAGRYYVGLPCETPDGLVHLEDGKAEPVGTPG
jgi:hypothetical protein